jgi:hypothetical protein
MIQNEHVTQVSRSAFPVGIFLLCTVSVNPVNNSDNPARLLTGVCEDGNRGAGRAISQKRRCDRANAKRKSNKEFLTTDKQGFSQMFMNKNKFCFYNLRKSFFICG